MKLQKKFRIDQDAYVEFCKKTTGSRNYITVAFTSVAIIVISAIFKFSDTYLKSALIGLIYAAIYAVIVIVFSYFTTVSSAKRAYEKNQFAKYRILLTFDERGLVQQTPSLKDFVVTWKEFFKVIETKLSFIFYVNRKQAVLVSKKALKEAEIAKLREIIFEYGTKNNVKLKLLPRQEELAAQIPDDYVAENEPDDEEVEVVENNEVKETPKNPEVIDTTEVKDEPKKDISTNAEAIDTAEVKDEHKEEDK